MRYRLRTLLILLAVGPPLIAFIPGYFWMGRAYPTWKSDSQDGIMWLTPPDHGHVVRIVRRYPHKWQKTLFRPAGQVEALFRGIEVYIELPPDDEQRELATKQLILFRGAINHYMKDTGTPPPNLDALLVSPPDLVAPAKWKGPYLDKALCPFVRWDKCFRYEVVNERMQLFVVSYDCDGGPLRVTNDKTAH